MTQNKQNISRRTLAKGAAWSAPVLAMSASVPAFAASSSPPPSRGRCLTPEEVRSGDCARILQAFDTFDGLRNYNTSFGRWAPANLQFNITVQAECWPYAQVMSVKSYGGGGAGYWIPRPTIVLPNAGWKKFTGRTTIGQVGSWGVRQGIPLSKTIQWENSEYSDKLDWTGAMVTVPLEFNWTDHGVHTCGFDLKFEFSKGWTGIFGERPKMRNYRLVLRGQ
ncbi:hypothetical protein [Rothia uropygioeca]|uniref:hypothetical protein n=1 Tax=Kocuria sp. 257 TaxID=2021970 RepID=UPI001011CAB3|nr:hypothetical protein [Kocuria sp. 257]